MGSVEDLARLQALLARALTAPDPAAALGETAELPPELARLVGDIDPDGFRVAALLVAKLRFERLMNGSRRAAAWWDRDDRGFAQAFQRYHAEVPPTATDPWDEAAAFAGWADSSPAG